MSRKIYAVLLVSFVTLAFLFGLLCNHFYQKPDIENKSAFSKAQELTFDALEVRPQNIKVSQKYIGYVIPIHEVFVEPFINGFIENIYVKGGEIVKKDDVLVILKQDEYKAALASAYADVLKAEADYKNKESYFKRIQKADKAVSAADLENAEAAYLASGAVFEQAKAGYELAKVNYDYTLIRAPITGVVGDVSLTKGNYVSPSTSALLNIVQYSPIRVVFSISDEEYLEELKKKKPFIDEKIKIELPNGEIFQNEGVFRYTDNTLDKATNSMAVYADFKNIGKVLTPNSYVTVWCEKTLKNAVAVSKGVVDIEDKANFVYIIRKGVLNKVPVEILGSKENEFILKNTFEKGDEIVLEHVEPSDLNKKAVKKEKA